MASLLEQLEADVRNATAAGFRGNLLARGQARSMIWRNGELPRNAPSFSTYLSYDLESYGYALLGMGLRLRELDGDDTLARMAFEQAATAIEAVVSRGNPEEEARGFHHVMAAAGFHLGHFSARAYSLLAGIIENGNLAPLERALSLLMLRNLEQLDFQILSWKTDGSGSDDSIIEMLQADAEQSSFDEVEYREDEPPSAIAAIDLALTDNFLSAVAIFLLALERGESSLVQRAITMLKSGLETCRELNLVPQWWSHHIGVHLIDDLWSSSFHVRLPEGPDGSGSAEWRRLRCLFIALLYRRRKAEIDLWPSQIDAAARAIDQSDDLVVSLPTSAGKTRVAELCILNCLASGHRVVFVTPLRALSAQTEISLRRTFLPLGKKVSALYGSIGSSDFEQDTLKSRDIVVATPEKLDFALRNDPSLLDDVGLVVFDEGHMIGPNEREVRYEVQIQRLLKRPDADQRRVVCLSAILPNGPQLEDFVAWFCRDKPNGLVQNDWRPTRLRYGEVIWYGDHAQMKIRVGDERPFVPKFLISKMPTNGRRRAAFPQNPRELTLATAWRLVEDGQTVLIYCPERRSVEPFAEAIVDLQHKGLLTSLLQADRSKLATARTLGEEWLGAGHSILRCLDLGVAIHHGALPTPFRKEIEKLLHEGILKITISSPTLAQGLNLSATAVVIHSLFRDRKIIDASEFRNVVGRAGRAYVDVEGLVLYPIFDSQKQKERLDQWGELIQKGGAKNMESGLAQLVIRLLARMYKMLGNPPLDELIEYVTNNTQAWDFPALDSEDEDEKIREHRLWRQYLSSLDTAILSLLGDQNVEIEHIATMIDTVLTSSLWERSLKHHKENMQKILKTSLAARANYIWTNSTANQRRGYFLAGVGLDTGKQLDAIAQEVNALLVQANTAILSGDEALAIQSIIALAERIFSIPPFVPDPLPNNWRDILRAWLEGEPISTVTKGHEGDALRFVEGGLVYRLPWGMEAIRVRAAANQETNDEGLTLDEVEMGLAVPAVENGTLNRSAALLMQAGFSSRLAAIKAVNDTVATFTTGNQLTEWIYSDVVVQLAARGNWPTPETTDIWKSFVDGYAPNKKMIWDHRSMTIRMTSVNGVDQLTQGMAVRLIKSPKNLATLVMSPSCEVVGELERSLNENRTGLTLASIGEDKQSVEISYFGPDDIMIPS